MNNLDLGLYLPIIVIVGLAIFALTRVFSKKQVSITPFEPSDTVNTTIDNTPTTLFNPPTMDAERWLDTKITKEVIEQRKGKFGRYRVTFDDGTMVTRMGTFEKVVRDKFNNELDRIATAVSVQEIK